MPTLDRTIPSVLKSGESLESYKRALEESEDQIISFFSVQILLARNQASLP
jgi:hypothetical protein